MFRSCPWSLSQVSGVEMNFKSQHSIHIRKLWKVFSLTEGFNLMKRKRKASTVSFLISCIKYNRKEESKREKIIETSPDFRVHSIKLYSILFQPFIFIVKASLKSRRLFEHYYQQSYFLYNELVCSWYLFKHYGIG